MASSGLRYLPCPCCGFPSITTMIAMTCSICWWEADGPIISEDERSSANHGYTLRQARRNFHSHENMYDQGREIAYLKSPSETRRVLMDYVRRVQDGAVELSQRTLSGLIEAEDEYMRSRTTAAQVQDVDEEALLRLLMAVKPHKT